MKINRLSVENFKSIHKMVIKDVENTLILVGRNSTGKTVILEAVLAASGQYQVKREDFGDPGRNIVIGIELAITQEDLELLHKEGVVSKYRRYELWLKQFCSRLPSYSSETGVLKFEAVIHSTNGLRYQDGYKKNNSWIAQVFPQVYYLDHRRELKEIQDDMFLNRNEQTLRNVRENRCLFDLAKPCNSCFKCIGKLENKPALELTVAESVRLLEYKLYHMKMDVFSEKVNSYYHRNGNPAWDVNYVIQFDMDEVLGLETQLVNRETERVTSLEKISAGARSIYMLSLLEAYLEEENHLPCLILIEDPELYLHPQLQKVASEILYRLSDKNQVMFSTYSPNLIFNFTSRQIRQVILDQDYTTAIAPYTNLSEILDDLGYTAADLMDVNFVFFVEGKQDRSRLPLLLRKYYSEIADENGKLQRISIISTNSCTNIRTYANLKYMNQLYIRDQFLMIRDGDGKDPQELANQLCGYYRQRKHEDEAMPRVTERNVLILKYYSFENYFLDPEVMVKIGVLKSVDKFYDILWKKYQEYLYRLSSFVHMRKVTGIQIRSRQDIIDHMEEIRIYGRGHNLYDIFYGRYKGKEETRILKRYVEEAPRETFQDILDTIDAFVYFHNRRQREE